MLDYPLWKIIFMVLAYHIRDICILKCQKKCIYHGCPQVLKDICRIYQDCNGIYRIYNDNIADNYRHFEDNFQKSVISLSYTLHANG